MRVRLLGDPRGQGDVCQSVTGGWSGGRSCRGAAQAVPLCPRLRRCRRLFSASRQAPASALLWRRWGVCAASPCVWRALPRLTAGCHSAWLPRVSSGGASAGGTARRWDSTPLGQHAAAAPCRELWLSPWVFRGRHTSGLRGLPPRE